MHPGRLSIALLLLSLTACTVPPTSAPPPSTTPLPIRTCTPISDPTFTPTPVFTPTPTPVPAPTATPATSSIRTPDPGQGSSQLGRAAIPDLPPGEPPPRPVDYVVVNPQPPRRVPNAIRTFWVTDGTTEERREIAARLRAQTEHVAMWVEEGVWHDVRRLEEAATFFETQIYPTTRAALGSEWRPGVDNDPHVVILHATGLGESVMGYTSSADEFPCDIYPTSNEAELTTVNVGYVEVGSPVYYALLACQLQHLIHWFQDRNEEHWVKEGLAELAVRLNGFDPEGSFRAYLARPETSLTTWEDEQVTAHRDAAYLFSLYFHERFGDLGTRTLAAQPLNGAAGFDATLTELQTGLTFEDLFADWLVANILDGRGGASLPTHYGYHTLDLEPPALAAIYGDYPVTVETSVGQFGADYVLLQGDEDLRIQFTGAVATPLLEVEPHSGDSCWWSNRADESLTGLTRAFDLSGVEEATLIYWTWYDIEPGYDYATVEISTDGGQQWHVLSTPSGTNADPHANNPGWGYTGSSRNPPGWIQEQVDLSPYTGSEALVRFAYLTDGAVTGAGLLLDDIAIPEIGYVDDVESGDGGWEAAGFVRINDGVPQRYLALLIGLGDPITVERLALEKDQTAAWTVPLDTQGWHEAVLVLSGLAPFTRYPALYQITIQRQSPGSQEKPAEPLAQVWRKAPD